MGVIAIGDIAIGGVAIGGLAIGGIAFGGCALGLTTFGGLSLGLFLALGGCAVGGLAAGGLAIGAVAIGGAAIGYYAMGGSVLSIHGFSRNRPDPVADDFIGGFAPEGLPDLSTIIMSVTALSLIAIASTVLFGFVRQFQSERKTPDWPYGIAGASSSPLALTIVILVAALSSIGLHSVMYIVLKLTLFR